MEWPMQFKKDAVRICSKCPLALESGHEFEQKKSRKQNGFGRSPMIEKPATFFVDEAGDGVLFGRMGRDRLNDVGAQRFFMLGMCNFQDEQEVLGRLAELRASLLANPLYSTIPSMQPDARKTHLCFHAKDDHAEIRSKVFELLISLDFKFHAVVKDMRAVRDYVKSRNEMDSTYRYRPNELYDLTVRMLFKQQLHKKDHYRIVFARRGHSDRTHALVRQLKRTRLAFLQEHTLSANPQLEILPAHPWEQPCIQITDYCLWALQRCYEKAECRFLHAIWPKVSLVHDVDDPNGQSYGRYLTRKKPPPDPQIIKNRWI
jgi:hypothetical protein